MDIFLLKIINLSLSAALFLIAWLAKNVVGVWLNPVSIFSLFWFFFTAFPLFVAFEAPVNPLAIAYILAFCIFFSLSALFFRWRRGFIRNANKLSAAHYFDRPLITIALYSSCTFATLMLIIGMLQQGFSIALLLDSPLSIGGTYASKRYSGEIVSSVYSQIGLQFSYCTVVLGGLLYGSRDTTRRRKKLIIISFLPSLLVVFLQSAKGLFFFSVFLFIGGVLVTKIYDKKFSLFNGAEIRTLATYGLFALPVVIASFLSRGIYQLNDSVLIISRLRYYLISYSSVHLPAFSDWFSDRYTGESSMGYRQDFLSMGFYTFMSFFRLAGDDRPVLAGIYDEYYSYGDTIQGNLYTAFRGLISDFTLPGSLLVAFILGGLCNFFYWRLLSSRSSAFSTLFFIYFVAISYQTYIVSSLTWITIPVAFLVQWVMLHFLMKTRV
ncbi:O-antigen polymerase [Aromatoleum buckelii]|uniref:O-antigen polymerase n=1 Tax=Aromatoleum buckelii TaxID=200254 RepID=UPI00145F1C5F|nr:O-antigen polymerase [Aromatoleum buckelii]MCK0512713.1 oligosaccharide repeat unit polymerase [Aromatoleum buckelii]